jgi:hypothetical protein
MQGTATHSPNNLSIFLFGAILNVMAAIDFTSLLDYSLKAVAGGIIWLAFKLLSEWLTERIKTRLKEKGRAEHD